MGVDDKAPLRNSKVASAVRTSLYGLAWISMMFWIVSMDGRSCCPSHCILAALSSTMLVLNVFASLRRAAGLR